MLLRVCGILYPNKNPCVRFELEMPSAQFEAYFRRERGFRASAEIAPKNSKAPSRRRAPRFFMRLIVRLPSIDKKRFSR
ncbi:MAG: hypothetical protein DBX55_08695 [Verrucomicrobia bacterium]|nr:MAG: hypothetical protein DBX55_08695 [Verrucomicrobiota bacterium]